MPSCRLEVVDGYAVCGEEAFENDDTMRGTAFAFISCVYMLTFVVALVGLVDVLQSVVWEKGHERLPCAWDVTGSLVRKKNCYCM